MSGDKPPSDPASWTLRHDGKDYVADSFDSLRSWFGSNRVPLGSRIFNPETKDWIEPESLVPKVVEHIIATTTMALDGYRITRYIDIESVEVVIGTGVFTEWGSGVADFFGHRSTGFEMKLQQAKRAVLQKLQLIAIQKGGDAVIGVDLDYTEFSGNRIGVIANGTIVKIEKVGDHA